MRVTKNMLPLDHSFNNFVTVRPSSEYMHLQSRQMAAFHLTQHPHTHHLIIIFISFNHSNPSSLFIFVLRCVALSLMCMSIIWWTCNTV
jgi:hypothetical protein